VLAEVGAVAEGLATLTAAEGLLGCVYALVPHQRGAVPEGLATGRARVGRLPAVDALVLRQVRRLAEGLAALRALVRPLSGVRAQVLEQVRALHEHFVARPAFEGLLPGKEARACVEGLAQLIPGWGLLASRESMRLVASWTLSSFPRGETRLKFWNFGESASS